MQRWTLSALTLGRNVEQFRIGNQTCFCTEESNFLVERLSCLFILQLDLFPSVPLTGTCIVTCQRCVEPLGWVSSNWNDWNWSALPWLAKQLVPFILSTITTTMLSVNQVDWYKWPTYCDCYRFRKVEKHPASQGDKFDSSRVVFIQWLVEKLFRAIKWLGGTKVENCIWNLA